MKKFNVTGICVPNMHYMVDTSNKLKKIMKLVNDGSYFTINRARQFGKSTTLHLLEKALANEYICIRLSFEGVGGVMFESESTFCQRFLMLISDALSRTDKTYAKLWLDESVTDIGLLSRHINNLCEHKKIVLMIDEVDAISSNKVFLRFLGMLRTNFLDRPTGYANTFHSVILAGVYDIKTIKLKLIHEGAIERPGQEERSYNSPWNIATEFNIEMHFNPDEIATMLAAYETDHKTGMDIPAIAQEIYHFTSGYPVLVSKICQCIAEELDPQDWSVTGVQSAVKIITSRKSVIFDDIFKNLGNDKRIHDFLYDMLIVGKKRRRSIYDPDVEWCTMFGYISTDSMGHTVIANKIFEIVLLDYFSSKDSDTAKVEQMVSTGLYHEIVKTDSFDMALCLRKFAEHYHEIYSVEDLAFLERHGRLVFLSFLKPLVNGNGFFHIESQFTDLRRMDVVVDYGREQFVLELKLWKGETAQDKAYEQLLGYMKSKNLDKGYLLTFDLRKEWNKSPKAEWVQVDGNQIFQVIV